MGKYGREGKKTVEKVKCPVKRSGGVGTVVPLREASTSCTIRESSPMKRMKLDEYEDFVATLTNILKPMSQQKKLAVKSEFYNVLSKYEFMK